MIDHHDMRTKDGYFGIFPTQIRLSLGAYKTNPRTQWVQEWPGQVVLAGSSVYWTEGVECGINTHTMQNFFDTVQVEQLNGLTDLVRKPLTPLARLTLGALIVIDVHARDVVMQLINEKVPTKLLLLFLNFLFEYSILS